jgi:hypothetical protein
MLNVIMLSVIMLNVVMLSVVAPKERHETTSITKIFTRENTPGTCIIKHFTALIVPSRGKLQCLSLLVTFTL